MVRSHWMVRGKHHHQRASVEMVHAGPAGAPAMSGFKASVHVFMPKVVYRALFSKSCQQMQQSIGRSRSGVIA